MSLLKMTFVFICMVLSLSAFTQNILLNNPSFEDDPADATTPMGWLACTETTTPDILPGYWGVYTEPSDGDTFVGIIVRPDRSHEALGQRLSQTLLKDKCYRFTIDLAHSDQYAGYGAPIKLRIYIGATKCSKSQEIFISGIIDNKDWETQLIEFTPTQNSDYIYIEAVDTKSLIGSKGNILLDNMSPIQLCIKA